MTRTPLLPLLAAAFVLLAASGEAAGEPITLAFEAEIERAYVTAGDFDESAYPSEGESIRAEVTFFSDPGNGADVYRLTQPQASAVFQLGGATLRWVGFGIDIQNNSGRDVDCNGTDCPSVVDSIEFSAVGLDRVDSSPTHPIDLERSYFRLGFEWNDDPNLGGEGVWASTALTEDPRVWSSDPYGASLVVVISEDPGKSTVLVASVGPLTVVPEPASITAICGILPLRPLRRVRTPCQRALALGM